MSRELLEKAAKAAGALRFEYVEQFDDYYNDMAGHPTSGLRILDAVDGLGHFPFDRIWNPLTDDGDALRLAVRLRMDVFFQSDHDGFFTSVEGRCFAYEHHGSDPYAATRLAIVRAAAAIGEAMK